MNGHTSLHFFNIKIRFFIVLDDGTSAHHVKYFPAVPYVMIHIFHTAKISLTT